MASCLPPETQERHSVFRLPFLSSNFIELFSSSLRLPANLKHLLLNPPSSTQNGELVVTFTSSFNAIWNDAGSGTTRDGGFWHPITQGTLRPLGSMAVGNFKELNGQRAALLIGANLPAAQILLLKRLPAILSFGRTRAVEPSSMVPSGGP